MSRPGATHEGSEDLDAGAIWCRAPEKGGPSSEELPREVQHAGLAKDQARGGAALEDTGGHPRQRADWGLPCGGAVADSASRRGKMCLGLFQYCRELLGTVLDSVAEQSSLG